MGLMLEHFGRLVRDIASYSWVNEVWWPLPLFLTLLVIGALAFVTQVSAPFIYAIF